MSHNGRQFRSQIDENGTVSLTLDDVTIPDPADDEIVVRIEAAPINPSDLGVMLGAADIATVEDNSTQAHRAAVLQIPQERVSQAAGRFGRSMPVGNEGAGTVVAAGANASHLDGKLVGMIGGGMYADYRKIKASEVIPLPDGATAADGASMFVNPLTALGFVETMRMDGHSAIVHTAAASNLGQMLQRICLRDGIPLVNVVRSEQQAELLREIGATHVVNSQDADFPSQLQDAIEQTEATIAFDAVGGGTLGGTILQAMEQAALKRTTTYDNYGSGVAKQLYSYGRLDTSPIVLDRSGFGFAWGISGWLLFPFLQKAGADVAARLRQRVADELTTTFASHYTRVIGLSEALQPEVLREYYKKATGQKFLINPTIDAQA